MAELATIGRPSLLIALPIARDQDQAKNAAVMAKAGAATVMAQSGFTPAALADFLRAAAPPPAGAGPEAPAARPPPHAGAPDPPADLVEAVPAARVA